MELTLVGTGHVLDIAATVDRIIDERTPDVVCVELDAGRLRGLLERRQLAELEKSGDPRAAELRAKHDEARKNAPLAYRMLARIQERLAGDQGVEAGGEMLAAVDAARRRGVPAACIDVDAEPLIRGAWGQMGLGERLRFMWALLRGQPRRTMEAELEDYESDPVAYLAKVGEEFPTLKRVLIDERDEHMARRLLQLEAQAAGLPGAPEKLRAVAVVGDGHVEGLLQHLRPAFPGSGLEVIRVADLRAQRVPESPFPRRASAPMSVPTDGTSASPGGSAASVSFSVRVPLDQPE